MIIQLNPALPVITPKGKAIVHFLIDDGIEHDLKWVCFIESTGECWTYKNQFIRAQKNITEGREYISPFYNPDDVAFPEPPSNHMLHLRCSRCEFLDWVPCDVEKNWCCPICADKDFIEAKADMEKKIDESIRFEELTKPDPSMMHFQKKITEIAQEMRGKELQILDDFCKAYYAAESYMTGKSLVSVIKELNLNIQQFCKDGQMGTRYWFSKKKDSNELE